jgi:hypothetical protein
MPDMPEPTPALRRRSAGIAALAVVGLLGMASESGAASVYKWVDASGVTHLSSDKPPAGVKYERVALASIRQTSASGSATRTAATSSGTRTASASPEQAARRNELVNSLRTRECVVALEGIDRLARGGTAVEPAEFIRLQQTADQNCSKDPAERRQQEDMAARLRVSKGDTCVDARNKLADLLEPGQRPSREQLKSQQEFIENHCTAPVR